MRSSFSLIKLAASILICSIYSTSIQSASVNYCQTTPARGNALDLPSKHAWDLFLTLNHPALDKKLGRGVADCSNPIGTAGTTTVWETWRNAASEVYLRDGSEPPHWDDTRLPDEAPGKVPLPAKRPAIGTVGILFSPTDGIFHASGGFGETRMNRSTYEFIRNQCLYSVDGQQRYALAVEANKKPKIRFPVDSVEAKAAWIDFMDPKGDQSAPPIPEENWNRYYVAEFNGKKYGLTALHFLTKDTPNWFWASFHHKDQPEYEKGEMTTPDDVGPPGSLKGTVWENYMLGGTQVDYTTPTGTPTILGDQVVEFGFLRSSCMTCHANATISKEIWTSPAGRKFTSMPNGQPIALCAIEPKYADPDDPIGTCKKLIGEDAFKAGTDILLVERGVPDPVWFEKSGKPFYLQTDFVFSIPFRGRSETSPPPDRCRW